MSTYIGYVKLSFSPLRPVVAPSTPSIVIERGEVYVYRVALFLPQTKAFATFRVIVPEVSVPLQKTTLGLNLLGAFCAVV
mgnify:CR=1 FL=1